MRKETRQTGNENAAVGRVLIGCAGLASIHSILAARPTKELARRIVGPRYRNGLYRFAYNVLSVVLLGWATWWFSRLRDRELYRVRPPWSLLLRMGQLTSLGVLLSGVRVIGILDFAGVSQLRDLLAGLDPDSEPEAKDHRWAQMAKWLVGRPFATRAIRGTWEHLGYSFCYLG